MVNMNLASLSRLLKRLGVSRPPSDAPKVGQTWYRNGDSFKVLKVNWKDEWVLVQQNNEPPQYCGYYSLIRLMKKGR